MGKITLNLPDSFKNLKSRKLESILKEELYSQRQHLPLNNFAKHGGWPDDSTLQIDLKSVAEKGSLTEVEVELFFDEVCSTGCADINRKADAGGLLFIIFNRETGVAHCEED